MPFSVHQSAQRKLSPNNSFLCFFTILEFSALLTVKLVSGDKKSTNTFFLADRNKPNSLKMNPSPLGISSMRKRVELYLSISRFLAEL